jgi:ABC-type dipeptide/oligopeptide/nickel transport system ATPase subunit
MKIDSHIPDPPGIAVIHASAVYTERGGLAFLGPSGTGKSTVCRFLIPYMQFLSNEAVGLISRANGGWDISAADTFAYTGPSDVKQNTAFNTAPLRAIIRLFQAPMSRIQRIDELKTCRYLTDALFEIPWQREYNAAVKKSIFTDLAAVCRSTPGYEFYFDLSTQIIEVLDREFDI